MHYGNNKFIIVINKIIMIYQKSKLNSENTTFF